MLYQVTASEGAAAREGPAAVAATTSNPNASDFKTTSPKIEPDQYGDVIAIDNGQPVSPLGGEKLAEPEGFEPSIRLYNV
jgi:hypothetical protein